MFYVMSSMIFSPLFYPPPSPPFIHLGLGYFAVLKVSFHFDDCNRSLSLLSSLVSLLVLRAAQLRGEALYSGCRDSVPPLAVRLLAPN